MKWPSANLRLWDGEKLVSPTYHQTEAFQRALALLDDTRTPGAPSAAQQLDSFLSAVWMYSLASRKDTTTPRRYQRRWEVIFERAARAREQIFALRRLMRKDAPAMAFLNDLLESHTCRPVYGWGGGLAPLAHYFMERPHLVGRRGGAGDRSKPEGVWRGACIAALDELLPDDIDNRASTIAALLRACGMPCTRHQSRGVIESRSRKR